MSINECIIEFEHLNNKMIPHQMKLPNKVLTFKLLDGENITDQERKLALTLCSDLDFDKMKLALKRIFTTRSNHSHRRYKRRRGIFQQKNTKNRMIKLIH